MKKIVESKPVQEITIKELCEYNYLCDTKILFAYKSVGK